MKTTATLLALMASTVAMSSQYPVSSPLVGEVGFNTMDQAAITALQSSLKISSSVEEAGALYVLNGKYYYTSPASNAFEEHFAIQIAFPKGAKLVALYHTHPNNKQTSSLVDLFSPGDVQISDQLQVISYIGVVIKSHVIKYIPGISITRKINACSLSTEFCSEKDNYMNISRGTVIGSL